MPTNRRRRRVERRADLGTLTYDGWRALATGLPFFSPYRDREELVLAWRVHEATILPAWVEMYPCTRPLGWWASERRERAVLPAAKGRFIRSGWEKYGVLHTHTWPAVQESERSYLTRHGLLSGAERAAPVIDEGWMLFGGERCLWRERLRAIYEGVSDE